MSPIAIELGSAYISILPDTSKLAPDVSKALGGVQNEAGKAGEKSGNSFGAGFTKKLKTVGVAAGAAIVGGLGYTLFKGFERLDAIDQAESKLRGLGHSAGSVDAVMNSALASVKGTAYGLGDAATVAASTVAAGIAPGKELERTLKLTADAATIAGTDMSTMGSIVNKVATSDMMQMDVANQLMDAGIPIIQMVADEMGVTAEEARKMASEGKVSFETFQNALEGGLGGAALESGSTFSGAMDNAKAAVGRLGEALLEPFFGGSVGALGSLTSLTDTLTAKAGPAVERFAGWLRDDLVPSLQSAGDWIKRNRDWIEPLAVAIGAAALAWGTWVGAIKLWQGITKVATGLQVAFNAVMAANPIMLIVMAIAALVAGLVWFFTQTETGKKVWQTLVDAFKVGWEWVKDAFAKAWDFISPIWDKLKEAFEVVKTKAGEFWETIKSAWDSIKSAFQTAWDFIQPILQGIWDFLSLVGQIIIAVFAMPFVLAWQLISDAITWAWETVISPIWDLLKIGLQAIGDFFLWVWESLIKPAWDALGAGISWVWENIIRPVWDAIKFALDLVGQAFSWVWLNVIKPAWDALGAGISWVWENVIKRVWEGLQIALNNLGLFFQWIWFNIIKPAWDALGLGIQWVWDTIIRPAWDALKAALQSVGDFFSWVWNSVIKPAWDALGNGIRWVIDSVILPAWEVLKGALDRVGGWFNTIVEGIRTTWDRMKGYVAAPINFVIDTVWNNGLVRAWNKIREFLPGIPEAGTIPRVAFASGGEVPFTPGARRGKDSVHGLLMPGEHVLTTAEVRALGGQKNVYAMRDMIRRGAFPGHGVGIPKFADGGAVGAVPGARLSPSPGEGGLQDIAKLAKRLIHLIWPSIGTIGGYRQDAYPEHPSGRALDVMVGVGNPIGDEVTGWALANDPVLPLQHALWKQTVWMPGGATQPMGDRGSPTQNHMDHPHLWYKPKAIDPNVVPEGLVGADGLTREDRLGLIKDKIKEILDKMMNPLIEGIQGAIGTPPPEWLGLPPKVATKSKDGAVDEAFAFAEKIGDDLRDVYNKARDVKDIVVTRVTGLWRDKGGFVPTGQSVVTNETGKPEAILNWDQLQQIVRLMESAGGLAAIHRWGMGDPEAARRHGVDQSTIDSIGHMNLKLAEHMGEVMKSAQASFISTTRNDVLDFFGLSDLVGGIQEVWDAFHPTKDASTTAATAGASAAPGTSGDPNYKLETSTVKLDTNMPDMDGGGGAPGSGPIKDQVKQAMSSSGWDRGAQWNAVDFIVQNESSWNPNAQNPTSTAYGLFQFLDSTWGAYGHTKTNNPKLQGEAGETYIKRRYGDPLGAERFWRANRWYDNGGWLDTGLTLVRNNTGTPEPVLNPSQWGTIARQTAAVSDLVEGRNSRGGAPLVVIENLVARDENEAMRSAMREARRASRSDALIGGW